MKLSPLGGPLTHLGKYSMDYLLYTPIDKTRHKPHQGPKMTQKP